MIKKEDLSFTKLIKVNKIDDKTNKFINHNKNLIKKIKKKSNSLVLVEMNGWQPFHISNSYLVNILAEKHKAQIVGFENFRIFNRKSYFNIIENFKWYFSLLLNTRTIKIYRSFGVTSFFKAGTKVLQLIKSYIIYKKIIKKIKNKKDVENITIYDVWVGDLIYDTYLKVFAKITLDINSREFKSFLFKSISLFIFWYNYFKSKEVKALSVSHGVYTLAFPIRIAHKFDVPVYIPNETKLIYFKKDFYSYEKRRSGYWMHYLEFKNKFFNLSEEEKKIGIKKAEIQLKEFLSGNLKFFYLSQSPYNSSKKEQLVHKSNNLKILVASPSFYDSPHIYGNFLFSDFYEWFKCLEKIMYKSNYDWYIKPHPNSPKTDYEFLEKFISNKKNVYLLTNDCSNLQLIKEGIQFVLTVHGSIGTETPLLGVNVMNASPNNPHSDFSFNINPKSVEEYENNLLNLNSLLKKKINVEEIYIYYFVRYIYYTNNWLLRNPNQKLDKAYIYSNALYDEWTSKFNISRHEELTKFITNFINSEDYMYHFKHEGINLLESFKQNNTS